MILLQYIKKGREAHRASKNSSASLSMGQVPKRLAALPRCMAMLILWPKKRPALWSREESTSCLAMSRKTLYLIANYKPPQINVNI